ncbi:hypothetical protein, partial [Streptomyces sp. NPDC059538]
MASASASAPGPARVPEAAAAAAAATEAEAAAAPVPAGAPGVRELAALLRAVGLDPSAEEIADALWLAGHIRGPVRAAPGDREPGGGGGPD